MRYHARTSNVQSYKLAFKAPWSPGKALGSSQSFNDPKYPMRSRAAYPPPRLTWNRHQYDPRLKKKTQWRSPLKTTKINTKIDPKWKVWGTILGGRGLHFGVILGVWAGSGSQMRLGRRSGQFLEDFTAKMASTWSEDGIEFMQTSLIFWCLVNHIIVFLGILLDF